jgi:DNA-binding CsgD family transcriptional regulator
MVEAGSLSLGQFIGRDDWLYSMGRASRGSSALADGAGSVYAASRRFVALLHESGLQIEDGRLPFALPDEALGASGGEFVCGSLHVRVSPKDNLYLLHVRQPVALDALSPREQEIARALGEGKTLKSIARHYGIAVSTVANHTTRIYRKLAIYRREDLIELIRARPRPADKNAA